MELEFATGEIKIDETVKMIEKNDRVLLIHRRLENLNEYNLTAREHQTNPMQE